jgi:LuxR family maltose regulon positive regulatory protein
LSDRHSSVAEFLVEEVLGQLTPERRDLLCKLAVLDVAERGLAEAVAGERESWELLRELAADSTFVHRIDGDGERYRFHPLLAELLRFEQDYIDPDVLRDAHARAATWLIAHDRAIEAIDHLLKAGEHARAHALVLDHFHPLYLSTHRRNMDQWLVAVPDDVIAESIERAVDHCAALAMSGHPAATLWWVHCSERVPPDDDWLVSRLESVLAIGHAVYGRLDEFRTAWAGARDRRPRGRDDPIDEILTTWDIRLGALLDDPTEAIATARDFQQAPRQLIPDESVMSLLAGALAANGDHDLAVAIADRAIERWREAGERDLPSMVDAMLVTASAARAAGRLDDAEQFVDIALALPPQRSAGPHALRVIALAERARLAHARGDAAWKSQILGLAEELRTGQPSPLVEWLERVRDELERTRSTPKPASPNPEAANEAVDGDLTERELEILSLLPSHLSLPEIGTELYISRHTVRTHVAHIYQKLGVTSRSEAVNTARSRRLIAERP